MAGENPVHVAHFVNDEDAKPQAEQTGAHGESVVQARESLLRIFERHGNRRGDQHHAGDGPYAEYQQIGDGPARVANRGQHQQRYRRRSRQPVDQSHRQGTQRLIQTELAENAVHPANGRGFRSVAMPFGIMSMRMAMNEIAMNVRMRMRVSPVRFKIPSKINISPTDNSIVSPSRGGMTTPKRIIAEPTRKIVMVCPNPHSTPIKAA
jgi:hypothetical protein